MTIFFRFNSPVRKCVLGVFVLFLVYQYATAQSNYIYNLPQVIKPSPQSEALTRYGDYPMVGYTGLTDITIPIHDVEGRKLSLPISMSFHASGRMANEINGILGMRWTLNCGGVVTRNAKGYPDEWNQLTSYSFDFENAQTPSFDFLYRACPNGRIQDHHIYDRYDTEYDIFNFMLPNGKSGHFIFKNVNGQRVPMLIPVSGLKIEAFKKQDYPGYYERFLITDIDGTKYVFGKYDELTESAIEERRLELDPVTGLPGLIPTAWYLTRIISSDGADEISISYDKHNELREVSFQESTVYDRLRDYNTFIEEPNGAPYAQYLKSFLYTYYFHQEFVTTQTIDDLIVPHIKSIQFDGGELIFDYWSAPVGINNTLLDRISLKIASETDRLIKFTYNKPAHESKIYYLSELRISEQDLLLNKKFQFSYYGGGMIGSNVETATQKDWWGYLNLSNAPYANLIPIRDISVAPINHPLGGFTRDVGYEFVNRAADIDSKLIGMLKKIVYPTGGETEFFYENNQYDGVGYIPGSTSTVIEGPGLRVKEVVSRPLDGKNLHKIYKYGKFEDGRGIINKYLRPGSLDYANVTALEGNAMHYWQGYIYTPYDNIPAEFRTGYRTRRFLDDPYIDFWSNGSVIRYESVSEYLYDGSSPVSKTVETFEWEDTQSLIDFTTFDQAHTPEYPRKFQNVEDVWKTPVITSRKLYRSVDGTFDLVKQEDYEYYNNSQAGDFAWDMPTFYNTVVVSTLLLNGQPDTYANYDRAKDYHNNFCSVYGFGFRKYTSGSVLLFKKTVEEVTSNGTFKQTHTYTYTEGPEKLVRSVATKDSRDRSLTVEYEYSFDFPSDPLYQEMVQKNILSPVISETKTVAGVVVEAQKTNYFEPHPGMFVPHSIERKTGDNAFEVVANFNHYDVKGNILEQQLADNVKEVYLWGYDKRYPVARVVGSDYATASALVHQNTLDFPDSETSLRFQFSNLRNNLPNAQVTTYTYKPFVGITSETKPNLSRIFYEYDGKKRLSRILDDKGNILKQFCYSYAGQPEACQVYFNTTKSATFTKNNCGLGFTGGSYVYTVPAYKYSALTQAQADQMALDEITANGQDAANLFGDCIPQELIYARVEVEDEDIEEYYDSGPGGYETFFCSGTYVLRFYSDPGCTIPLTLTSPIHLSAYDYAVYHDANGVPWYYAQTSIGNNIEVPAGVSSYVVGYMDIFYMDIAYENYLIDYESLVSHKLVIEENEDFVLRPPLMGASALQPRYYFKP